MAEKKAVGIEPFPNEEEGWCISRWLLFWVHPLIRKGWTGDFDAATMA